MTDLAVLVHQVAVTTAAILISICALTAIRRSLKSLFRRGLGDNWVSAEE